MENLTSTLLLKVATDAATYSTCSSQQAYADNFTLDERESSFFIADQSYTEVILVQTNALFRSTALAQ